MNRKMTLIAISFCVLLRPLLQEGSEAKLKQDIADIKEKN